jgi:hypothetical protein
LSACIISISRGLSQLSVPSVSTGTPSITNSGAIFPRREVGVLIRTMIPPFRAGVTSTPLILPASN